MKTFNQQLTSSFELVTEEDNWEKDFPYFNEEIIQKYKQIPTQIHVVFTKRIDGVLVDRQEFCFETEEDAIAEAETIAINESAVSLDLWNFIRKDIADLYILKDYDELNTVFKISMYPMSHKS